MLSSWRRSDSAPGKPMKCSRRYILRPAALLAGLVLFCATADAKGPPGERGPSAKVRGKFTVKVAGYYTGSGQAHATGAGLKINVTVRDPSGASHELRASKLEVVNDRFRGSGELAGATVEIDGRLDAQDRNQGGVLKKGRITFTFRTSSGHSGRGAGALEEPGGGS